MRIYEAARLYKKSSQDIIALLKQKGFNPSSHMSVLTDKELAALEVAFRGTKNVLETTQQQKKTKKAASSPATKNLKGQPSSRRRPLRREKNQEALSGPIRAKDEKAPLALQPVPLEPMLVGTLATYLNVPSSEVIVTLLRWGIVAAKNNPVQVDVVGRLAEHFGAETVVPVQETVSVLAQAERGTQEDTQRDGLVDRSPVIVIVGHVDHGKTSLLDYVRHTRVVEKEKGGITQHIGAYEATTSQGKLVLVDTPGHEAFSKMRERGVRIADIAVLIVAADDGVMPQTVEAIKHINESKIPVVVAITKIDKAGKDRVDVIKRQLAQHEIFTEDWGGDVVCVAVSSKTGSGIEELLEMVALQSQILELRAEKDGFGKGYILESKLEKGRGPVATVIGKHGTLSVGDYFVCGTVTGKITSLVDSFGNSQTKVGPSVPVQVAGFDQMPAVGDYFHVVSKVEYKKTKNSLSHHVATDGLQRSSRDQESRLHLILKTDTNSSLEALSDSVHALADKAPVPFSIIDVAVGLITEGDVELAYNTNAVIIGLHTKAESKALSLAQRRGVRIELFTIIYKLLEFLQEYSESKKERVITFSKAGEAVVLRVFDIKGVGVIAGCRVTSGRFTRNGKVVVLRNDEQIAEGKLTSLQREKRSVKEVLNGMEFGFSAEGIADFAPDDKIEFHIESTE